MIQSILLFTLRPGVTDEQVEALRAALAAIPSEGRRNMRLGRDIGLLDGAIWYRRFTGGTPGPWTSLGGGY